MLWFFYASSPKIMGMKKKRKHFICLFSEFRKFSNGSSLIVIKS